MCFIIQYIHFNVDVCQDLLFRQRLQSFQTGMQNSKRQFLRAGQQNVIEIPQLEMKNNKFYFIMAFLVYLLNENNENDIETSVFGENNGESLTLHTWISYY